MDDVNVNKLSDKSPILIYNKFFGDKIWEWNHSNSKYKFTFKVKEITLKYDGRYQVWCEILSLEYDNETKISSSKMITLLNYFKRELNTYLNLCSIDNYEIVIYNRSRFEIENPNKNILFGGDYRNSVSNYYYTSPKDNLRELTGYKKLKFY
jgi:hypothetical protein